jgi:hypothetical protein
VVGGTVPPPAGAPKVKGLNLQVNSIYNGWRMEDIRVDR